ncbi:MAG: class III poly(R)-hydroxyalkanoic acid synthase subunit PhaC [Gammaproteobacteria bacterium]|nr:class III poly(R)-hydroxyalkanoic acid synthase subunit PhaC [Gammaproteobacteria bacterium]
MNPFNFNPEDIVEEIEVFGRKFSEGMSTLAQMETPEVGVSKKTCVYEEDKLQLFRYAPRTETQAKTPLLIVYALVNRPYMADLQKDRSLIQGLLDSGLDIYLIDWGYPDDSDQELSLDDYINRYLNNCVEHICLEHNLEKINLLGICQGGVFSLCYSALHQNKVANLITTVTPVDFHTQNDRLSNLVRHIDIDLCIDAFGNLPGSFLNSVFLSLKPYRLLGQKYVDLVDIIDNEEKAKTFMRMEKWIFDSPDQAGETFREFISQFYQNNGLIKGAIKIGDWVVDLQNIKIPVLNIFARDDHLVPTKSSKALADCIGSDDYSELELAGGHIGIYVRSNKTNPLPKAIKKWVEERN